MFNWVFPLYIVCIIVLSHISLICGQTVAPVGQVGGDVDVWQTNGQQLTAMGWACVVGNPASIAVHIYAGKANSIGTILGATTANLPNEGAVNTACGAAGNHRFSVTLNAAGFAGRPAGAYGISTNGGVNNKLEDNVSPIIGASAGGGAAEAFVEDAILQVAFTSTPNTDSSNTKDYNSVESIAMGELVGIVIGSIVGGLLLGILSVVAVIKCSSTTQVNKGLAVA